MGEVQHAPVLVEVEIDPTKRGEEGSPSRVTETAEDSCHSRQGPGVPLVEAGQQAEPGSSVIAQQLVGVGGACKPARENEEKLGSAPASETAKATQPGQGSPKGEAEASKPSLVVNNSQEPASKSGTRSATAQQLPEGKPEPTALSQSFGNHPLLWIDDLVAPEMLLEAEKLNVVWARVKGYPPWPAQLMDAEAATKWLAGARPGKGCSLPLMFFGTFEVCWLSPAAAESWKTGAEKGYFQRAKRDKRLPSSIQQAIYFLKGVVHPQWWWQPQAFASVGNQRNSKKKEGIPVERKKRKQVHDATGKVSRTKRGLQSASEVKQEVVSLDDSKPSSAVTKPEPSVAPPSSSKGEATADEKTASLLMAKRRSWSSRPSSTPLPGGQAPVEPCGNAKLPKYEFTKKNMWPGYLSRPKRLPKDNIAVCDCRSAQQGEASTGNASQPAYPGETREGGAGPVERAMRVRAAVVQELGKAGCGPNCMNRESFVHCDPKTCPCGEQCTNKPFHLLNLPKMMVFHTGDRGWGVRAEEFIPEGTFIVEYAGELLNKTEKQRRLEEQARTGVSDFYMMEHSPGVIIDARLKGNLARLINSSCDPNCETQKWRDAATDEGRIGIFAKRDIQPGEELAYDYNFEHSGLAEQAGAYRCKCGATSCRGTMDTHPQRLKDAYKRIEVYWDGEQTFYRGTVMGYQPARGLHIIQYDDGQRTKENLSAVRHRWLPDDSGFTAEGQPLDAMPELGVIDPPADSHQNSLSLGKQIEGGTTRGETNTTPRLAAPIVAPPSTSSTATDFQPDPDAKPPLDTTNGVSAAALVKGKLASSMFSQPPKAASKAPGECVLMSILQKAAEWTRNPEPAGRVKQAVGPGPAAGADAKFAPEPIIKPVAGVQPGSGVAVESRSGCSSACGQSPAASNSLQDCGTGRQEEGGAAPHSEGSAVVWASGGPLLHTLSNESIGHSQGHKREALEVLTGEERHRTRPRAEVPKESRGKVE